ncbi:hypothetical protein E3P89_03770 [Wallemia ichthyophaga]|uniref:RTR1-type domain-containing protein n=1 Tax=Wallemia ichthyophaga TaxID=245174 RepID=A0A4T0HTD1_WALIC|nr:hypothetical protein E3P93_03786 [Wallemia ichthyophaga]TIB08143.1 hypothetical protein E3P90_03796 [Wallemia ichthyophaga]TIB19666.1 hypothetical protein E3P89_03770 [Wallemia ichthyophaga]TIB20788.1 hypothetical protein E3P88_03782 [Wallemia ichthyophaga]
MSSSHPLKLDVVDDELRREKRGKQLATAAVDTMNDVRAIERAKKAQDLVELKLTMKMTDGALSLSEFKHSLPLLSAASLARIQHERHLADLCAYPTCSNRPRGAYGSARDTLRIDRISLSVYSQNSSTDIAFCGSVCQQRAQWARTRCVGKVESDTSLLVDRNPHQRVKLLEEWGFIPPAISSNTPLLPAPPTPPTPPTPRITMLMHAFDGVMKHTNKIVTAACILTLITHPCFSSIYAMAGAGIAALIAKTLKRFIIHPRPYPSCKHNGMPSTHSTVAGWLFVNLLSSGSAVHPALRVAGLLYLIAMPISRITLGLHSCVQVSCGAALGVVLALGAIYFRQFVLSVY